MRLSAFTCAVSALGFMEEERSDSAMRASAFLQPGERNCEMFHLNGELYYEVFSGHTFPLECTLAGKVVFQVNAHAAISVNAHTLFFMHEIIF